MCNLNRKNVHFLRLWWHPVFLIPYQSINILIGNEHQRWKQYLDEVHDWRYHSLGIGRSYTSRNLLSTADQDIGHAHTVDLGSQLGIFTTCDAEIKCFLNITCKLPTEKKNWVKMAFVKIDHLKLITGGKTAAVRSWKWCSYLSQLLITQVWQKL